MEGFQVEVSVLPVKSANAKELAAELISGFETKADPTRRRVRRIRRRTVTSVSAKRVARIIPDERTNSLVVVASGDDMR